jgi:hypothetical protein
MKKTITLVVFFSAFAATVQAQIPNASFENWTTTGGYSTPDGWDNLNALTSSASVYTCEKGTTGAPHGSSFLMLTTRVVGSSPVYGVAMSGKLDMATQKPKSGFPFAGRPSHLTGKWQYMAMGSDTGRIAVYLTKWNTTTNQRDLIAQVEYNLPGMVMSWTPFAIPLTYSSSNFPDSAIVGLISSYKSSIAVAGSYLYVDSLNFFGTVGINDIAHSKYALTVSPNPAKDKLSIDFAMTVTDEVKLWVMDMYGKVVTEAAWEQGNRSYSMDLNSVAPGLYFVKVMVGEEVQTKRLVVE